MAGMNMRYFVDPVKYALSKELFAFKTERDRDEYRPECTTEVAEIPSDYSPAKYAYNFDTDEWDVAPNYEYNVSLRRSTRKREEALKLSIRQTQHWDMIGEPEQVNAWRSYYLELHALEQTPEWPLVEQWPTPPNQLPT